MWHIHLAVSFTLHSSLLLSPVSKTMVRTYGQSEPVEPVDPAHFLGCSTGKTETRTTGTYWYCLLSRSYCCQRVPWCLALLWFVWNLWFQLGKNGQHDDHWILWYSIFGPTHASMEAATRLEGRCLYCNNRRQHSDGCHLCHVGRVPFPSRPWEPVTHGSFGLRLYWTVHFLDLLVLLAEDAKDFRRAKDDFPGYYMHCSARWSKEEAGNFGAIDISGPFWTFDDPVVTEFLLQALVYIWGLNISASQAWEAGASDACYPSMAIPGHDHPDSGQHLWKQRSWHACACKQYVTVIEPQNSPFSSSQFKINKHFCGKTGVFIADHTIAVAFQIHLSLSLFDWQYQCKSLPSVLFSSVNLQNDVAAVIVFPDKEQEVVSFHGLE